MSRFLRSNILIKTPAEIEQMQEAGAIAARALRLACEAVEPGISTQEVNDVAEAAIREASAVPTFLGYSGFPASICASINSEVVHGIPSKGVKLCFGDVVAIDVGATYKGWIGDNADTVAVGEITDDSQQLIDVTRKALYAGIAQCVPGNRLGDISHAIGKVGRAAGLGIIQQYVGHGVGKSLHEEPSIPNEGKAGKGPILKAGMVFALEPMFTLGIDDVVTRDDHWTVVTKDGSRSAQIEHTVAVTEEGPLILTKE
ncbi:MAG: type I methionyl aminopeptidase [Coriobacteriia bacterium]|nr:type I methionyl aminopeptidase [Coriobacteriia bacterium]MCL2870315.1 type I methionyl aminopeptidase [Coriobacteriia bacterium]